MDDLLPIGKFSQLSGLSVKRLRDYAAAGVLTPTAVDAASGYRFYSADLVRSAHAIDALRNAGLPLAQIVTVLSDPSDAQLDGWVRRVEGEARSRQQALSEARRLLGITQQPNPSSSAPGKAGRMHFTAAARSDIGLSRDNNEDAVMCRPGLVAVADGMGGHAGGEVAATMAVTLLEAAVVGRSADELAAAVRAANRAIFDRGREQPELRGMGTTLCAVCLIEGDDLVVGHVGDSRAYVVRDGEVERLTTDHTVTATLVRDGQLTEAEAAVDERRVWLTRVVGGGPTLEVDVSVRAATPGERVVVCSDGLFSEVGEEELSALLTRQDGPQELVDALVDRALANGGRDNVSVIVADVSL